MKKKVSIIIPFFNEKENIPIILSELELVIIKLKERKVLSQVSLIII